MSAPILSVENLTVRFGGLVAVNDATLTLGKGEIRGLIGPNGAGKTTLFNAVSGLVPVAGGTVQLDGRDITRLPPHTRARLGIRRTFQSVHLVANRTVLENVATGLDADAPLNPFAFGWLTGRDRTETAVTDRVVAALDELGIADTVMREVRTLSFAQQRFVEIARAIVADPPLLLLDEPAAGLSAPDVARFTAVIRRLRQERSMSVLLVEHVISLVTDLCDRVCVLDDGELIAEGEPADIMANPIVRAAYLGELEHA